MITKRHAALDIFFRLDFDNLGAFITIVDRNGNEIETSYEYYSGSTRDVLKSIETIRERNNFRIDWERPSEKTYLSEHEYLLWQLRHCNNFVDERFAPIRFTEEGTALIMSVEAGKGLLESTIVLKYKGDLFRNIQLLTENHAFVNGAVFRIQPLGENFKDLRLFESKILPMDLEKFLSLLYSYFENITVKHEDYRQIEGPPKAHPADLDL